MSNTNEVKFSLNFDAKPLIQQAEEQMVKGFKNTATYEINNFFSERIVRESFNSEPKKVVGAGLELIRDFLEKKFDDPKTAEYMEKFFNDNFDRMMEEALRKALEHKAKAFVFPKAQGKQISTDKG